MTPVPNLFTGFQRSAERFGSRPAILVDGEEVSYAELGDQVCRQATAISDAVRSETRLVGLLANRSRTAYAGALAALASGRGYVPLNPKHPLDRLKKVLALSAVDVLIAGREGYKLLPDLLAGSPRALTVLLPDAQPGDTVVTAVRAPHRPVLAPDLATPPLAVPHREVSSDALAYLLFTSGSTGEPKGVAVTHSNVRAYARALCDRFQANELDRFSQMSDLSFDWSVHDLYVCWEAGGCLVAVPESSHLAPAKLVRDQRVTMWAAVPSTVPEIDVESAETVPMPEPGVFPRLG